MGAKERDWKRPRAGRKSEETRQFAKKETIQSRNIYFRLKINSKINNKINLSLC